MKSIHWVYFHCFHLHLYKVIDKYRMLTNVDRNVYTLKRNASRPIRRRRGVRGETSLIGTNFI